MANEPTPVDVPRLREWIGRSESVSDVITPRLEASLRAVFDRPVGEPAMGELATPTVHWCLAPAIAPMSELGPDGHPARGGFMPPVPLPRRMWAGGELTFLEPLRVGDVVTRDSQIQDVSLKTGRSGTLCFVTVLHRLSTARGPAIEERQDIVYRDEPRGDSAKTEPRQLEAQWHRTVPCDPVLLFRYSALTFNGHRIHYDRPYATTQEGYPDLVVHGPLQAAMLIDLATEVRRSLPRSFSFRGVSPLLAGAPFTVNAAAEGDGVRLWSADAGGHTTMQATARWP